MRREREIKQTSRRPGKKNKADSFGAGKAGFAVNFYIKTESDFKKKLKLSDKKKLGFRELTSEEIRYIIGRENNSGFIREEYRNPKSAGRNIKNQDLRRKYQEPRLAGKYKNPGLNGRNTDVKYEFIPEGVCTKKITFELCENKIHNLSFEKGCNGNLKAISKLVEGKDASEIRDILKGNTCGARDTSCADQLAMGIDKALSGKL